MERAAQVGQFDQLRQPVRGGGLDLARVLAQLGRDVVQTQRAVELRLVVDVRQRLGPRAALARGDAEAVFVDDQPRSSARLRNAMWCSLLPVKWCSAYGVFRVADQPQVALHAAAQPHGHLGAAFGDDLRHVRACGEELAHGVGVLCRSDEIQVAHDLLAPPQAAALAGADDRRVRAQFLDHALRLARHVAEPVERRVGLPLGDVGEQLAGRLVAEPGQRRDPALAARLFQGPRPIPRPAFHGAP